MLQTLTLRNFVIVRELELDLRRGLTVLTGETGAGKSILIDALGLLLGDRADPGVVRHGAEKAELAATFALAGLEDAQAWLADNELTGDEADELLLRRVIDASGKSRAWINGAQATLAQLRELGEMLVEIHGQHEHQTLLKLDAQRSLLDGYANATGLAREVAAAFRDWRRLADDLSEAETNAEAFEAERERLQWQVDEVGALQFTAAEWPELQAEHKRLNHAASLIDGVQAGLALLADGDENCQGWLANAGSRLAELADYDAGVNETLELLAGAEAQLAEAVSALRHYADRLELDPERLAEVEARMDAVFRMARKYRVEPEQLPARLASWRERLEELGGSAGLDALRASVARAESHYRKLASQLSEQRRAAAAKLAAAVTGELQHLALAGSRFEIALNLLEKPAAFGLEQVEFLVANHASAPAKPMAKIASGGELSRISLALQVITSQVAGTPTLIFDEVDVGIGGRVAEIVGRLLADLGQSRQVLCITHLPQVAARGQNHLQVSKSQDAGGVASAIRELEQTERIEEIARMLGGVEITETTRSHAREMLQG
ncbi:DNA repair protein RecN (Recombination protein N) [Formivibrio citricus]|uniref:DNA repair protein RecN n=1 Tax=Formivibrio citricus TaxID=83765 RepID=A0A1I4WAD2_9NEIS|nr:DNA repair protein RecN [Formivibrio citricus]SFN10156.1 DNA repair protein RecN (Recombination protein N) [Formivibrio citricus]